MRIMNPVYSEMSAGFFMAIKGKPSTENTGEDLNQ